MDVACESQDSGHENEINPSPTHFQQLVRNASLNGSKRKRLNGVAKNTEKTMLSVRNPSSQAIDSQQSSTDTHPHSNRLLMSSNSSISSSLETVNTASRTDGKLNASPCDSTHENLPHFSRAYLRSLSEPPITDDLHKQYDLLNKELDLEMPRLVPKHLYQV